MIKTLRRSSLSVLRFFNLLEPGRNILSITKIAMWVSVWAIIYCLVTLRDIDLSAIGAFFGAGALYAWRRYVFWKTGQPGTGGGFAHGYGPRHDYDNSD